MAAAWSRAGRPSVSAAVLNIPSLGRP
jgi:hypothetical protein